MTAPDPARLAEITARAADCQTYNFGLRNADQLAHVDVPYLLGIVGRQAAAIAAVKDMHHPQNATFSRPWISCGGCTNGCPYPCPTIKALEAGNE